MKIIFFIISLLLFISIITYRIQEEYIIEKDILPISNIIEHNNFENISFYKKENSNRYINYKFKNPDLKNKDIVLRVNIGLDKPFYTNTKEIKDFDMLMIVNKYNFVSKDFIPNNLVLVDSYAKENMYLQEECKNQFINMARNAEIEGFNIRAISTYRTYDYQEKLYNNYVKKDGFIKAETYSARPGYSEHHTGLAIDVDNTKTSYDNFLETEEFNWLVEVDRDFIEDDLNQYDIRDFIFNNNYDEALEMILSPKIPKDEDINLE